MKIKITVDSYISHGGGGVSEGRIEFEDGTLIAGSVQSEHCCPPETDLNSNTTKLDDDTAVRLLEWGQIMLGLDEGQSHEMDLDRAITKSVEWES